MGSDRCTRTTLVARCCSGAFFGFGFALTVITLAVMFWIAWCYFGLTIIQISDSQRRAIVNYSYTTSKPVTTPTTALPSRSTTLATEKTSINSISKLPTTESILRGSSRDVSASASVVSLPRGPPRNKEEPRPGSEEKASILTASSVENSEEDRIYARRVFPPGSENRPEETSESGDRNVRRNPSDPEPISRLDISPTKAYDVDTKSESSRVGEPSDRPPRDEARTPPRDYPDRDKSEPPRRDDIQSSRRPESETAYREPDFDREYPRRYATSSDRERSRYDELDDERGSRGRYDKRDRGRESDDRYPKGDTRVYPDDRDLPTASEERYRARERYPEDIPPKRGDDDRYDDRRREYDERSRNRDRDTRYRDRDLDDRSPLRDERLRDDDPPRSRDDERYRDRDEVRYIPRDDDRHKPRDDDRYRARDDDRPRPRDEDRLKPRDDDRYVYREGDRYKSRDDDRYRVREDDKYKTRVDGSYRSDPEARRDIPIRPRDEKDEYRPRVDEARYVDSATSRLRDTDLRESVSRGSSSLPVDRKSTSSRSEYDIRGEETVSDYDVPVRDRPRSYVRDDVTPSRLSRPSYDDERYRDRDRDRDDGYRRPSRYEDEVRNISPTKTRDDIPYSRSSLIDPRPRDDSGSRYTDTERDRIRDDRYYDQDSRIRNTRIQDSRSPISTSESSRRFSDDDDRYRTRLPNERTEDRKFSDRREEVVLDRRSYASEEDEEYSRRGPQTDEERARRPIDETRRRYRDDESYLRRDPIDDEDYKRSRTRDDYDRDRSRSRDRYDEEYRRYDDKYSSKDDKSPPLSPARKYDTYPDEDGRTRRRDPEISTMRKDDSRDREENLRPSSSSRDEERLYSRDEYPDTKSSSRRRYDDDLSLSEGRDLRDDPKYPRGPRQPVNAKDIVLGSSRTSVNSREPTDIVIREKRFQSSDNKHQSSRVQGDVASSDRSYTDIEPKSRDQVRPLSAKDVIEAAIRHSDGADQNSRKVYYPVFDPRASNMTTPEIIRPNERRGTTITAKKRRSISLE